jgi:hypothetical protein
MVIDATVEVSFKKSAWSRMVTERRRDVGTACKQGAIRLIITGVTSIIKCMIAILSVIDDRTIATRLLIFPCSYSTH